MPYYAVAKPESKIFDNWPECQSFVSGVSGAIYKKFSTLEEAEAFAYRQDKKPEPGDLIAYTDGSYNRKEDKCGSGIVFVKDGQVLQEYSFASPNSFDEWNITGEIEAVIKVIELSLEQGLDKIFIAHDLVHLGEWVRTNSGYRPQSAAAKEYVQRYKQLLDGQSLKVYFNHVKGHSGNQWNEQADFLARQACGL